MIYKHEDCEYIITIADLMVTLDKLDAFELKIWIRGNEIPFDWDEEWDFEFMQESLKVSKDNRILYIYYDEIVAIGVVIK